MEPFMYQRSGQLLLVVERPGRELNQLVRHGLTAIVTAAQMNLDLEVGNVDAVLVGYFANTRHRAWQLRPGTSGPGGQQSATGRATDGVGRLFGDHGRL